MGLAETLAAPAEGLLGNRKRCFACGLLVETEEVTRHFANKDEPWRRYVAHDRYVSGSWVGCRGSLRWC